MYNVEIKELVESVVEQLKRIADELEKTNTSHDEDDPEEW